MDKYTYLANAETSYIDELYRNYKDNPVSVDTSWQKFFEGFDFSLQYNGAPKVSNGSHAATSNGQTGTALGKEILVRALIAAYRERGHLLSNTNPVRPRKNRNPRLELSDFNLTEADLNTVFEAGHEIGIGASSLKDIIDRLSHIYTSSIGYEYNYLREPEVLQWFTQKVERESQAFNPPLDQKKRILSKLNEAVVFENFLHTKYVGQKRFSLEGGESTIPALDAIITRSADFGAEEVVIGMAHRGRLNVLCNIMGKTYENIFNEFEGAATPDLTMGDGDVKYHVGFSSEVVTPNNKKVNLKLCPNPSHLEAVNPVVEGYVRAKADSLYNNDYKRIVPLLIHGDAAVAGQGVVYEVTQMCKLEGYNTGGTIHFVINNQVGFTTDFDDARSSTYCSDVAKIVNAPVIHVNGDHPEAVFFAAQVAAEFRQTFQRDIFIDMVCYRRHGHNESDEPKFTQPTLYNIIAKHPNPREVYSKHLVERGEVDAKLAQNMDAEFRDMLQDRLNMVKQKPLPYVYQKLEAEWRNLRRAKEEDFEKSPETAVAQSMLEEIARKLVTVPDNFKPLKQVEKLLEERQKMFFETKQINWALAELLAYGSLLNEDHTVRISGQDVKRGTFSHRHAVLFDANTNAPYNSLGNFGEGKGAFNIFNSLLSEYAVLGFEFGYAMANPKALVVWEAQFGDFANGAQVAIDQFITSSESKWQRMNGVTLLLPHGYEGQGPEHSNARPERFLQLAAENNIVVANITQPANFFHLLRRQLTWDFRKPLVVMSPKSMLRHPLCVSPLDQFTQGGFREVLGDTYAEGKARKVLLCTGKVYFDLAEAQKNGNHKDVAIIRLEQLYPFPLKQIEAELKKYKGAEVYWVQEEPANMGYWTYILREFRHSVKDVVARKLSASPATGYLKVHVKEQAELVAKAFE